MFSRRKQDFVYKNSIDRADGVLGYTLRFSVCYESDVDERNRHVCTGHIDESSCRIEYTLDNDGTETPGSASGPDALAMVIDDWDRILDHANSNFDDEQDLR